jgi:hypothetical protein
MNLFVKLAIVIVLIAVVSRSSAAQNTQQGTSGNCSPTVSGVSGNVTIIVNCSDQPDLPIRLNATLEEASKVAQKLARTAETMNKKDEIIFWQAIQDSTDPKEFEMYLRRYPAGIFSELAHSRIERLIASVDRQGFALRPDGQRICQTIKPPVQTACGGGICVSGSGSVSCDPRGLCVSAGGHNTTMCRLANGDWVNMEGQDNEPGWPPYDGEAERNP